MYHRSTYLLFLVLNLSVFGATSAESPPAQPPSETANVPAVPLPKEFGSDSFAKGIQQLQTKDASGALTSFREALLQHPDDTAILTNLGIAAQEAGLKGWAIAYLREALTLGSRLRETRQALEYSLSQLQVKELPHEIEPWEKLRENVLVGISLPWLLFFNGGALLLFGIVWIRFLKERKLAFENESLLPTLRPMHWAASFVFLISLSLVACKILDLSEVRATIVAEKVSAYSAPSTEAPTLFEITEGLEVLVQREEGKWLQIRYPGGPTGWVNLDQVHITQSQNLLKGGI
jgi:hypothetical protein